MRRNYANGTPAKITADGTVGTIVERSDLGIYTLELEDGNVRYVEYLEIEEIPEPAEELEDERPFRVADHGIPATGTTIWSADTVAEASRSELDEYRDQLEAGIVRLERALEASVIYASAHTFDERTDHGDRVQLVVTDSNGNVQFSSSPSAVMEWLRERAYVKLSYPGQLSGSYTTGRAGTPPVVNVEGAQRIAERRAQFRAAAEAGELRGFGEAL